MVVIEVPITNTISNKSFIFSVFYGISLICKCTWKRNIRAKPDNPFLMKIVRVFYLIKLKYPDFC